MYLVSSDRIMIANFHHEEGMAREFLSMPAPSATRSLRPKNKDIHGSFFPSPSNSTDPSDNMLVPDGVSSSMGLVGRVMISLSTVFGFIVFVGLAIFLERRRERAARSAAVAAAATRQEGVDESPADRYRNIEKWLVTKRVEVHDHICDTVMDALVPGRMSAPNSKLPGKGNADEHRCRTSTVDTIVVDGDSIHQNDHQSSDSAACCHESCDQSHCCSDHAEECPICFEPFQVDELISWSPEQSCVHRFHHHCIKEWLRRNKECPYCRETFLPIDRLGGSPLKKINELILAQHVRSAHCYYCLDHGVVYPPSHYSRMQNVSAETLAQIKSRSEYLPSLEDLSKIRGAASCDDDTKHQDEEYGNRARAMTATAVMSSTSTNNNEDEQSLGGVGTSVGFLGDCDDIIVEEPEETVGCDVDFVEENSFPSLTVVSGAHDADAVNAAAANDLATVTPHETWGHHLP